MKSPNGYTKVYRSIKPSMQRTFINNCTFEFIKFRKIFFFLKIKQNRMI